MDWKEQLYNHNKGDWDMSKKQLLRLGECCGVTCRNCPYSKPRKKGNIKLEKNDKKSN